MQRRHSIATLVIAVLVVFAGCSALPGGSPTDTQTTTETPPSNAYLESGEQLNETKLLTSHRATLRSAGSYTSVHNTSVSMSGSDSRSVAVDSTYKVNLEQDQYTAAIHSNSGTVVKHTTSDGTYAKYVQNSGGNASYVYESEPYNASMVSLQPVDLSKALGTQVMTGVIANTAYTQEGVETHDGVPVTRFTADSPEDFSAATETQLASENATVEDFQSTLLVTEDGTIKKYSFTLTITKNGTTTKISHSSVFTGIGKTTASAPTWTSNATA